jgi:FkbM family methyltransferase
LLRLSPKCELVYHPGAYRVFQRDQVEIKLRILNRVPSFKHFRPTATESMLLFDIGAHFGIFALVAAHFGGMAVAVDPSPIATRMIKRRTILNGCDDRVKIVQAAVGDAVGTVEMLNAGVFSDDYYKVTKGAKSERCEANSFDHYWEYGELTHIKIDVEGHESAVLLGATSTLSRCSPVLFMELHNQMVASDGGEPGLVLDELESFGYQGLFCNGKLVDRATVLEKPIAKLE